MKLGPVYLDGGPASFGRRIELAAAGFREAMVGRGYHSAGISSYLNGLVGASQGSGWNVNMTVKRIPTRY